MRRAFGVLVMAAALYGCGGNGDVSSQTLNGTATNGGSRSTSTSGSTGTGASTGTATGTGTGTTTGTGTGASTAGGSGGSTGSSICDSQNCVVYASADHDLYQVDPTSLQESHLCTFNGALSGTTADVVTDIAVTPDGTLYAITETALYTVSPTTCAATKVSTLSQSGTKWVGLTFTVGNTLLAADTSGNVVTIDTASGAITPAGTFGGSLKCSGDIVAINDANGTIYATATTGSGNDQLVTLDPSTHKATAVGSVGYSEVYGLGYWAGKLYGFTHSGGQILQIDPSTGAATVIGTQSSIKFSGGATTPLAPVFQ